MSFHTSVVHPSSLPQASGSSTTPEFPTVGGRVALQVMQALGFEEEEQCME